MADNEPVRQTRVDAARFVVGRRPEASLCIPSPTVSREHAEVTVVDGGLLLRDLGSTNGTFVNGRRVTGPVALSAGDMIGLGDTVVLAVSSAADAAVTQVSRVPTTPSMQPARSQPVAPPPASDTGRLSQAAPVEESALGGMSPNTRRALVIGCAGLALLAVICGMAMIAWSFLDCPSFAGFWRNLPILGGISIGC
jgi:pSer/pThr/pTyr-binding forkhead associated (FHA) protein